MPESGDSDRELPNTRFYSVSANRKLIFLQKISLNIFKETPFDDDPVVAQGEFGAAGLKTARRGTCTQPVQSTATRAHGCAHVIEVVIG